MESNFSLLSLFSGRDLMTLCVSIILVVASIMSWAVIIEKIRLWRFQKRNPVSVKTTDNLDTIVDKFIDTFFTGQFTIDDNFPQKFDMFAYSSYLFPCFMDSFAAIGVNQSVSIGVIAPGLAVALGTTALGLIAAVPAAIAYNVFSKKSDDLYDLLDDKVKELKHK